MQTVDTEVPVERFENPDTEEVKKWDKGTLEIKKKYQMEIDNEIKRLENIEDERLRKTLESWVTIFGGIVAGLAGAVSIVISIRNERRNRQDSALS